MPKPEDQNVRLATGYILKDFVPKDAPKDVPKCDKFFVCSTAVVDRANEIIDQRGWDLEHFHLNPVMLANHQHKLPDGCVPAIGSWPFMFVLPNPAESQVKGEVALVGGAIWAATARAADFKIVYDGGHQRAVSVGFIPKSGEYQTINNQKIWVHREQELLEVSAVAIGCNHQALARMYQAAGALGLTAELHEEFADLVKARTEAAVKSAIDNLLTTIDARFSGLSAQVADGLSSLVEVLELSSDTLGQGSPPATEAPAGGETPPEADENGALGKAVKDLLKTCRT